PQRTGGGGPRVLLSQRSGGGIAGVGERRLARLHERGVQLGKRLDGEEHLTTDLDALWVIRPGEPARDALDRAHVVRDILTGATVAAGRCPDQPTRLAEPV